MHFVKCSVMYVDLIVSVPEFIFTVHYVEVMAVSWCIYLNDGNIEMSCVGQACNLHM